MAIAADGKDVLDTEPRRTLNTTVLLQGETGTGKELVAQNDSPKQLACRAAVRRVQRRRLPESLAEAELFGHSKGAFTGPLRRALAASSWQTAAPCSSTRSRSCRWRCNRNCCARLQEREIERVGESRPIKFDARVIVATSSDLPSLVKEGKFREDLFYRLNVVRITLPPLRNRPDDIPLLARHFVDKACHRNHLSKRSLGQDAIRALMGYDWPGNVRELENAVEHAVALSGIEVELQPARLPPEVIEAKESLMLPSMAIRRMAST